MAGENDPTRQSLQSSEARTPRTAFDSRRAPGAAFRRFRKRALDWQCRAGTHTGLYLSETLQNPKDPNSPTTYFITVEGQDPNYSIRIRMFLTSVAHQGDVEDWIIENRTRKCTTFHIHQIHFHVARIGLAFRSTNRFCAIPLTCLSGTANRPHTRPCACAWIFAIPTPSATFRLPLPHPGARRWGHDGLDPVDPERKSSRAATAHRHQPISARSEDSPVFPARGNWNGHRYGGVVRVFVA